MIHEQKPDPAIAGLLVARLNDIPVSPAGGEHSAHSGDGGRLTRADQIEGESDLAAALEFREAQSGTGRTGLSMGYLADHRRTVAACRHLQATPFSLVPVVD